VAIILKIIIRVAADTFEDPPTYKGWLNSAKCIKKFNKNHPHIIHHYYRYQKINQYSIRRGSHLFSIFKQCFWEKLKFLHKSSLLNKILIFILTRKWISNFGDSFSPIFMYEITRHEIIFKIFWLLLCYYL